MSHYASAFAAQLIGHRQFLFARAMRLEASRAAADDLVQDTFERAIRAYGQYKQGTNLRGWLLTIMTHLFVDRRRRSTREALMPPDKLASVVAPEPSSPKAWELVSTVDIQEIVEQLHVDLRTLMALYLQGVCSYRQLSDALGVPPNTVGTRLLRARRTMRSLLEQRTCERTSAQA
jgi:RNA polymerase sigma-70 factor, ECF subfamily